MPPTINEIKDHLYGESTVAKIWGIAKKTFDDPEPPVKFPEVSYSRYNYEDIKYWTCGFFPGSVYALLERSVKYPGSFPTAKLNSLKVQFASRWWSANLVEEATRTDMHDLGFIICPSFIREHELFGTQESLDVLITAANSLASRFDEKVGCIRSWTNISNKIKTYNDPKANFLVIIDNMCNLELLYYVASKTGDLRLSSIATRHAETTLKNHFRNPKDWSCYHVVDYNQVTGEPAAKFTHQGYSDESAWSRGQGWAILGYIDSYHWTKKESFLRAAKDTADYFLSRLPADGVPGWDFDAPTKDTKDVSAAMIAALGMIRIYEYTKEQKYLDSGIKLVSDSIKFAYNDPATLNEDGSVHLGETDTILDHSTTNKNELAQVPHADHGLVYADYYFLTIGNKLLELGLV